MSESSAQSRPVIRMSVCPKASIDLERFQHALHTIAQVDPTVKIKLETLGLATINGMSELHLAGICDQISHEFQIPIDIGQPKVIYLETVRTRSEAEGKYIRQTGGTGNYGHCKISISPNELGKGYKFTNDTKDGTIPQKYIEPIDLGVQDAMQHGIRGYEMVDIKVSLCDGSYHDVDSNEMAFKIAGSMAFKDAARKAKAILLEPIMAVEVTVREDHMGMIIGGLNSRRGRIEGIEGRAGLQVIKASVPLSKMLGYATDISASTQGTGDVFIRFARYEAAPPRDDWGGDGPGVSASRPNRPTGSIGPAASKLNEEFQ